MNRLIFTLNRRVFSLCNVRRAVDWPIFSQSASKMNKLQPLF